MQHFVRHCRILSALTKKGTQNWIPFSSRSTTAVKRASFILSPTATFAHWLWGFGVAGESEILR